MIQIFCIAVVHRPESIMFLLLRAMCRQLCRVSCSHGANQCKATEMERDVHLLPLSSLPNMDFRLTREEKILPRATWPINMYTAIPGWAFLGLYTLERDENKHEKFQFNYWVT